MPLTFSTLMLMVLLVAAFAFWYDSTQVRETANRIAIDACRRRSLQLLDGTVALAKLRPRLDSAGLRIERTYVFDYSSGGGGRASGFVIMLGHEIQHVGLANEEPGPA
jgi:hypothetical protein